MVERLDIKNIEKDCWYHIKNHGTFQSASDVYDLLPVFFFYHKIRKLDGYSMESLSVDRNEITKVTRDKNPEYFL